MVSPRWPRLRAPAPGGGAVIVFVLLAAWSYGGSGTSAVGDPPETSFASQGGKLRVSFTSRLQPVTINRIHDWILHVETAAGEPVEGAAIEIAGGMPAHDHGLPTVPAVTRDLGDGDYLAEGLRFHMNGYWELELTIVAGDIADTVVIPLTL